MASMMKKPPRSGASKSKNLSWSASVTLMSGFSHRSVLLRSQYRSPKGVNVMMQRQIIVMVQPMIIHDLRR